MKTNKLFLISIIAIVISSCGLASPQSDIDQTGSSPVPELVEVDLEPQTGDTLRYIDGTTLVYIPAGDFTIGVPDGVDNPQQNKSTQGFWIYSTEVTNSQYALCVTAGQCTSPDGESNPFYSEPAGIVLPVSGVTHEQAQSYCGWVKGRLPSEIEWEKTARGPDAFVYPWGNDEPTCDKANFKMCREITPSSVLVHPAGESFYKAYDMAGNVFEWVADWYDADAYVNGAPDNGEVRVVRGGSFKSSIEELASYQRSFAEPDEQRDDLGFRCVVEDPGQVAAMCIVGASEPTNTADGCYLNLDVTSNYCSLGKPYANIKIDTNVGTDIFTAGVSDPGECDWNGNPLVCSGPEFSSFTVSLSRWCHDDIEGSGCPDGYELDTDTGSCTYKNDGIGSNSCLEGYVFNTESQCCTAKLDDFPVCPAGYVYDGIQNTCRATAGDSVEVYLDSCTITTNPGGCTLTTAECPSGVNESNCSCWPAPQ